MNFITWALIMFFLGTALFIVLYALFRIRSSVKDEENRMRDSRNAKLRKYISDLMVIGVVFFLYIVARLIYETNLTLAVGVPILLLSIPVVVFSLYLAKNPPI